MIVPLSVIKVLFVGHVIISLRPTAMRLHNGANVHAEDETAIVVWVLVGIN